MAEEKHYKERYGTWAGNARGHAPNFERCCATVTPSGGYISQQCGNKRGYGPKDSYCKIHDPDAIEKRRAESRARHNAKLRHDLYGAAQPLIDALLAIEAGHNDPRALAKEVLDEKRKKSWWKDRP